MESRKRLMEQCRRAMHNVGDAVSQLGLDSMSIEPPTKAYCSISVLQNEYLASLTTAEAARKLGMGILEKQCMTAMEYISAISTARNFRLTHAVEVMLAILDEEQGRETQEPTPESDESREELVAARTTQEPVAAPTKTTTQEPVATPKETTTQEPVAAAKETTTQQSTREVETHAGTQQRVATPEITVKKWENSLRRMMKTGSNPPLGMNITMIKAQKLTGSTLCPRFTATSGT